MIYVAVILQGELNATVDKHTYICQNIKKQIIIIFKD
jgi:hypothetical protein